MRHVHVAWDYLTRLDRDVPLQLLLHDGHDHVVGARVCHRPGQSQASQLLAIAGGIDGHEGLGVDLDELLGQLLQLDQKVLGSPPVGCNPPQDLPENLLSQNSNPNCTGAVVCFRLIGQITADN